jgi:hypothetical protein
MVSLLCCVPVRGSSFAVVSLPTNCRSHRRVDLLPHSLHARDLCPFSPERALRLNAGSYRSYVSLTSISVTCEAGYIADRVGSATCDVRLLFIRSLLPLRCCCFPSSS